MPIKSHSDQRSRIERSGRLHNVHYAVVAISFLLTVVVWQYSERQAQAQVEAIFDRSADQILELTTERMQRYEDGLWAGVAAINANRGEIDLASWRAFSETLQIDVKYPGINGIGVIRNISKAELGPFSARQRLERPYFEIHPQHDRDVFLPIVYIEPEEANRPAVGLDMSFENNRFDGIIRARDSGMAQITGPITLVQDEGATPGFLFYAPFYEDADLASAEARQNQFRGVVYAPFVVKKLMRGVLDPTKRQIWVSITDGDQVIYDEHSVEEPGHDPKPMFSRTIDMNMFGRTWRMDIRTTLDFRTANFKSQPQIILACGIVIDMLLLALFVFQTQANRRAVTYADQVTAELQHDKRELLATNDALEQFSYAASHDLKTPIRSMRDATDYLVEDLRVDFPQVLEEAQIQAQIECLRQLVNRMDKVVKGVFECAQITQEPLRVLEFSSRDAILASAAKLDLGPDRLELAGDFPMIRMPPKRFKQIIENLLDNCMQHHGSVNDLRVTVSSVVDDGDVEFSVIDNGPGIARKYHDRVFEMFQTLNPEMVANATGVGLAIVRKATEAGQGSVSVRSETGQGATFVIKLPGIASMRPQSIAAE
ncbi:MAG: CHASE domain-containing protein [Paracoccaceae bacterium]